MQKINKNVINLIQDLATPHNNIFIKSLIRRKDIVLKLWYANSSDYSFYQWKNDITHQVLPASIYSNRLNLSFLWYCLSHKKEQFVMVGWMNVNTRVLHLLFFLLRRPFNHWTDYPKPYAEGRALNKKILRWAAYKLLRYSKCKIFGVGNPTIDYFLRLGFPKKMLVNLPIFIDVNKNLYNFRKNRNKIRCCLKIPKKGYLLLAGSRLTKEKGFDLLIQAFSKLSKKIQNKTKLVIVGNGKEKCSLLQKIRKLKLEGKVIIKNWMEFLELKKLIANSDIFFHPARFDAFGGTALAMALGVPVIGSTGAGAALDRIVHGKNGFLYEAADIQTLAFYIEKLLSDSKMRRKMANCAHKTSLLWPPDLGAKILIKNCI